MSHACICQKPLQTISNTGEKYHSSFNCPQDNATGWLCHKHFEMRSPRPKKWQVAACKDCQAVILEQKERIQREDTIDPNQPWGQHIALTCKNHLNLRWSTKNISYIGARSIFYFSETEKECACPAYDLIVVPFDPEKESRFAN